MIKSCSDSVLMISSISIRFNKVTCVFTLNTSTYNDSKSEIILFLFLFNENKYGERLHSFG